MNAEAGKTIEIAGQTIFLVPPSSAPSTPATVTTSLGSVVIRFPEVEHLLSSRPLRRPNRTRPLDSPGHGAPARRSVWLEKLACLRKLESGWNRRGAPAPSDIAIASADLFMQVMTEHGLEPTRLAASAVGGVGITRRLGERMVYVEFYNDGSACALFSDDENEGETIPVRSERESFNHLLSQMEAYLDG